MIENKQAPDTQGNSTDGLSGSFGTGSSTQGMTDNVNPDGASTETGFAKVGIAGHMTDQRDGDETLAKESGYGQTPGGVCGRPGGWER